MFLRKNGLQRYYLKFNFYRVIKKIFSHKAEPQPAHYGTDKAQRR